MGRKGSRTGRELLSEKKEKGKREKGGGCGGRVSRRVLERVLGSLASVGADLLSSLPHMDLSQEISEIGQVCPTKRGRVNKIKQKHC